MFFGNEASLNRQTDDLNESSPLKRQKDVLNAVKQRQGSNKFFLSPRKVVRALPVHRVITPDKAKEVVCTVNLEGCSNKQNNQERSKALIALVLKTTHEREEMFKTQPSMINEAKKEIFDCKMTDLAEALSVKTFANNGSESQRPNVAKKLVL